uniref:Uncharacterized protein n=1 Tax=Cucumis melo TaxID=3656 RepID=A0A9I9EJB9_CUCME
MLIAENVLSTVAVVTGKINAKTLVVFSFLQPPSSSTSPTTAASSSTFSYDRRFSYTFLHSQLPAPSPTTAAAHPPSPTVAPPFSPSATHTKLRLLYRRRHYSSHAH